MVWAEGRRMAMAVMLALVPLLSACGFSPLYGEHTGAAEAWRQVKVEEQHTRLGQLVRNALLAGVAPAEEAHGAYILSFVVASEETGVADQKVSGIARKRLTLKIRYQLKDARNGSVLTQGRALAETSYPLTRQHFANVVAREQAQRTLAKQLAEDVRMRIAAWLAQPRS